MSFVLESADARDFRLSVEDINGNIANLREQFAVVQYKLGGSMLPLTKIK
jgi:hypothetical protein